MRNNDFDTFAVRKCCEKKLQISFGTGGEANGWFRIDGRKACRITVPHGRKPLPPKTYKSMAQQLKLTISEFDSLLACTLVYDSYLQLVRTRVKITPPVSGT
jgi:hypothetical protein